MSMKSTQQVVISVRSNLICMYFFFKKSIKCGDYKLFKFSTFKHLAPLHVQLAHLWPNGCMDNHEIKCAISRAKQRRKALYSRHKVSLFQRIVNFHSQTDNICSSCSKNKKCSQIFLSWGIEAHLSSFFLARDLITALILYFSRCCHTFEFYLTG